MCGIAGVYAPEGTQDRTQSVRHMLTALSHRGPDDEGIWSSPHAPLTLGHRRLSVIDVSEAGHEPMLYGAERFALTFNGEIYNYQELRSELYAAGHRFRSATDAEVLLAGYAEWGTAVLDRLVGMFAFAIWDDVERVLFLARDRAGEKPLYFAGSGHRFAFASELSALRHCSWVDATLDRTAVRQFLQYGYVPAPLSPWTGVKKLPPAHYLLYDGRDVRTERYWDPVHHATGPRSPTTEHQALEELEHLLSRAVRMQSVADVPLGAFLSGGIDSTAIVALMRREGGAVQTFTIGFDEPRFDESEHARAVAQHLDTTHSARRFTLTEALTLTERLPTQFGEPFGDPSALPTTLVSATAREHVTVSLSGDGGDELFGGYAVYARLARWERSLRLARPLRGSLLPALTLLPGKLGRRAKRLAEYARTDGGPGYRHYFTPHEVARMTGLAGPNEGMIDDVWRAASSLSAERRAMITDFSAYLPEDVLTKVDRAAMSQSLETRAPFLDHRVVEWALGLPDELVTGKRLLKRLVHRYVPPELVDRPKQGFSVPVSRWFRQELREPLLDELTPSRLAGLGIADPGPIRAMLRDHMRGQADYGRWLWIVYSLCIWHHSHRQPAFKAA